MLLAWVVGVGPCCCTCLRRLSKRLAAMMRCAKGLQVVVRVVVAWLDVVDVSGLLSTTWGPAGVAIPDQHVPSYDRPIAGEFRATIARVPAMRHQPGPMRLPRIFPPCSTR